MGGNDSDRRADARPITLALTAAVFLAYFDRAVPSAGAAMLRRELALDDAALGFAISTAAALAYATVAIGMALIDGGRWRRAPILIGMTLWTAGAVSLAFAATWRGYVAGELAIGVGQGLFVPAAATLIANSGRDAALGRATARFTTASTTGRSSAVLVTGLLIAMLLTLEWRVPGVVADWRGVFVITAAPNLALLAVLAWWRPTTPAPSPRPTPATEASPSGPGWIGFIGCAASAIAPVMMIQSIGAWYPLLLTRSAGMTPAHAAMLAGAATLMATPLGQWLGGRWLDRHPSWRRWPVRTVAPALILSGAAIAALGAESAPAAAAALVIADLALGVAALAGLAAVQSITPLMRRRRANSLFFALITLIGVGLAPLLTGALSDLGGASGPALARALGAIAAAALLIATIGHLLCRASLRYRTQAVPTN